MTEDPFKSLRRLSRACHRSSSLTVLTPSVRPFASRCLDIHRVSSRLAGSGHPPLHCRIAGFQGTVVG
jgi:hypothetical protein